MNPNANVFQSQIYNQNEDGIEEDETGDNKSNDTSNFQGKNRDFKSKFQVSVNSETFLAFFFRNYLFLNYSRGRVFANKCLYSL